MVDLDIDEGGFAISQYERIHEITGDPEDMKVAQWLREDHDGTKHPEDLAEEEN